MSLKLKPREYMKKCLRNNHSELPRSIRCIIVGKSGSGKSTVMLNLLTRPGWLDYNRLLVYGKALFQPEYVLLKACMDKRLSKDSMDKLFDVTSEIDTAGMDLLEFVKLLPDGDSKITCEYFESGESVPPPAELNPHDKNLMVMDDIVLEKQKNVEPYWTLGRHVSADCFYLTQNYHKLPRQTIRENSNLFLLFKQDLITLQFIYRDHCSIDFEKFEEFKKLCTRIWSKPHHFLTIDMTKDKDNGRYKDCFDPIKF